jgi:hypothetical protein
VDERETLRQTRDTAQAVLAVLEKRAAGYTSLTIPAHLQVQLDEKRQEVTSLQMRLDQLEGRATETTLLDNLPRPPAIFVGRREEIARCFDGLSPDDRGWGVTIDGIGGIGKTALALVVAHQARQQALFDACLFVSAKTTWLSAQGVRQETLARTSLDAFVREFMRLMGHAQDRQITDAREPRRALLEALRGRRVLLVWDNLETLTEEERGLIAEFLQAAHAQQSHRHQSLSHRGERHHGASGPPGRTGSPGTDAAVRPTPPARGPRAGPRWKKSAMCPLRDRGR